MQKKTRIKLLIILVLALIILSAVAGIWANYMWFDSLGYSNVFWTLNLTRFVVGAAVFIVFLSLIHISSIIGGTFLTNTPDAIVLDMGGTTTDIAILENGIPFINQEGASVGGWLTRVQAAQIYTYG